MNGNFELKIIRQHWIKDDGLNDNNDCCSHGSVFIKIGNEILSTEDSGSWTLSAAGLLLMRTLRSDYAIGDFGSQLIPCCGHFMYHIETGNKVEIIGCPSGVNWKVVHSGSNVVLTTENGIATEVEIAVYTKHILEFVIAVEAFYGHPKDKILPNDENESDAFKLFWKEWHELKLLLNYNYMMN